MNVQTLQSLLETSDENVLLIDVRESEEISQEPFFKGPRENYLALPLSFLTVLPLDELSKKISESLERLHWPEKTVRIITLCRSGMRSEMACLKLSGLGFQVESLDGGLEAWKKEGKE